MRPPPFHRRILPWIFFIIFIGVAPALVFYTAGYRWNPKKSTIERNGTVILDSLPSEADIMIDGRKFTKTTPVTIQNMAPGLHEFELSKPGYFSWKKSLEVVTQYVTFANDVLLWKQSEASLTLELPPGLLRAIPDSRNLLFLSSSTSSMQMKRIDTETGVATTLVDPTISAKTMLWSPNGRYAFLEPTDASQNPWIIDSQGDRKPLQLPVGRYRWENATLVGNTVQSLIHIRVSDFSLSRTVLPKNRIDVLQDQILLSPTGTKDIAFVDTRMPEQGFLLPSKNWNFWQLNNAIPVLRDKTSWISLVKKNTVLEYHTAEGDELRQDPSTRNSHYLLVNRHELWLWDPQTDPELLLRNSNPIVAAVWHPEGKDLFYATNNAAIALNFDNRSGRLETTLATFDEIFDMTFSNTKLFILATKSGKTGLWTLEIE